MSHKHTSPVGAQVTVLFHAFRWFFPQPLVVSLHTCALKYSAEYSSGTPCKSPEFSAALSFCSCGFSSAWSFKTLSSTMLHLGSPPYAAAWRCSQRYEQRTVTELFPLLPVFQPSCLLLSDVQCLESVYIFWLF